MALKIQTTVSSTRNLSRHFICLSNQWTSCSQSSNKRHSQEGNLPQKDAILRPEAMPGPANKQYKKNLFLPHRPAYCNYITYNLLKLFYASTFKVVPYYSTWWLAVLLHHTPFWSKVILYLPLWSLPPMSTRRTGTCLFQSPEPGWQYDSMKVHQGIISIYVSQRKIKRTRVMPP